MFVVKYNRYEVVKLNISNYMQAHKDEYIKDLQGLIQIPSLKDEKTVSPQAPFGQACRDALDYMLELGKAYGFEVKDYDGYAGTISYGNQAESVGVLAHLDVVPVEENGWMVPPFSAQVVEDVIFGRGVKDDKGPAMCGLYAMRYLKENNIKLKHKIILILGCDEESGMSCMSYYLKHGEIPKCGFTPDADFPLIHGEKGGLHVLLEMDNTSCVKNFVAGERANIVAPYAEATLESNMMLEPLLLFYAQCYKLSAEVKTHENSNDVTLCMKGVGAHGAHPELGKNAATHLMHFIGEAMQDETMKALANLLSEFSGKGLNINVVSEDMGSLTMNVGIVRISEKISITLDIRYPHNTNAEALIANMQAGIAKQGLDMSITIKRDSKPLYLYPNGAFIQTLMNSYQKYSGDVTSKSHTIGGGTYARRFENFVAYGPMFPHPTEPEGLAIGNVHETNEGMAIEDLLKATSIYTDALLNLGGVCDENA